jgi:hypothetical protein
MAGETWSDEASRREQRAHGTGQAHAGAGAGGESSAGGAAEREAAEMAVSGRETKRMEGAYREGWEDGADRGGEVADMIIEIIQFMLPDGRQVIREVEIPEELGTQYMAMKECGCR